MAKDKKKVKLLIVIAVFSIITLGLIYQSQHRQITPLHPTTQNKPVIDSSQYSSEEVKNNGFYASQNAANAVVNIVQSTAATNAPSSIPLDLINTSPPQNFEIVANTPTETTTIPPEGISWDAFISLPKSKYSPENSRNKVKAFNLPYEPIICDDSIVQKLNSTFISNDSIAFCRWATNKNGGKVVVGKSWGTLTKKQQQNFELNNCNAVNSNTKIPTCNDLWGDSHVKNWQNNQQHILKCDNTKSSKLHCIRNENKDQFCTIENAQINFNKYIKIKGSGMTPDSKKFEPSFLSTDCAVNGEEIVQEFSFPHLFSTQLSSQHCDVVLNGTTILYSHDNMRNMGHMLNDIMNMWLMMWLDNKARYSNDISLFHVDALKQYNNFGDKTNQFFEPYYKNFRELIKGVDFEKKVVCLERVMIQPHPSRGFVWDSWHQNTACSYFGPSSMYQRWNLHVRRSYNLLSSPRTETSTNSNENSDVVRILLIVRSEAKNDWGSYRSSRLYKNLPEIEQTIESVLKSQKSGSVRYELVPQDMGKLSFDEQIRLVSTVSLIIGMHGAGITLSMYMNIGKPLCCGVLEIYPAGEFTPVRGHENMIRKAGIHYNRIDIHKEQSYSDGAVVPTDDLSKKVSNLLKTMQQKPSCILPQVLSDPYMESI